MMCVTHYVEPALQGDEDHAARRTMITPAVECSYPLAEAIRSFVEERPQGKATITGERVAGEVNLNEPGEYSKVAKIVFDLPIVKEAPAAK